MQHTHKHGHKAVLISFALGLVVVSVLMIGNVKTQGSLIWIILQNSMVYEPAPEVNVIYGTIVEEEPQVIYGQIIATPPNNTTVTTAVQGNGYRKCEGGESSGGRPTLSCDDNASYGGTSGCSISTHMCKKEFDDGGDPVCKCK